MYINKLFKSQSQHFLPRKLDCGLASHAIACGSSYQADSPPQPIHSALQYDKHVPCSL